MSASKTTKNTWTSIIPVFLAVCPAAPVRCLKMKQMMPALSCRERTEGYLTLNACTTKCCLCTLSGIDGLSDCSNTLNDSSKAVVNQQFLML